MGGELMGLDVDTGLTEQIMAVTATDEFNTALEVQQSQFPSSPTSAEY